MRNIRIRVLLILFLLLLSSIHLSAQKGKALRFNSSTSKVVIPYHSDFDLQSDFTIEAVVYITSHPNPFHTIIEKYDGIYGLYITQNGYANAWITTPKTFADVTSLTPITLNEWHHIAAQFDSSLLTLWVDGWPSGSTVVSPKGSVSTSTGDLIIGGQTKSSDRIYGYIDEVRFSKKVRYKTEFDPKISYVPDAFTLGLYHFDEGSGNTANDASSKKHTATLTDVQWVSIPLGVNQPHMYQPISLRLNQSYPNPLKTVATIEVDGSASELKLASLKVYDLLGREIIDLSDQLRDEKSIVSMNSSMFPESGFYFYKLQFANKSITRKLTVLK